MSNIYERVEGYAVVKLPTNFITPCIIFKVLSVDYVYCLVTVLVSYVCSLQAEDVETTLNGRDIRRIIVGVKTDIKLSVARSDFFSLDHNSGPKLEALGFDDQAFDDSH